jgi:RiboL-PSP-HEPN
MILSSSLQQLDRRINSLTDFLKAHASLQDLILTRLPEEDLGIANSYLEHIESLKYQTSIIELYGAFETFVEDVIKEYLKRFETIYSSYNEVDSPIRDVHLKLTIELLSRFGRRGFQEITPEGLIQNIHFCNSGQVKLNYEAFYEHTSNVRWPTVVELLSRIGIKLDSDFIDAIKSYAQSRDLLWDKSESDISLPPIFGDLADRRNLIAHGKVSDKLAASLLEEWCRYVLFVSSLITDYLSCELASRSIQNGRFDTIALEVIKIFNSSVLCFKSPSEKVLAPGTFISMQLDGKIKAIMQIATIERDNVKISSTKDCLGAPVGVKFGNERTLKDNYRYFVVFDRANAGDGEPNNLIL